MVAYMKCEVFFGKISTYILSLISVALLIVLWLMWLFINIVFPL